MKERVKERGGGVINPEQPLPRGVQKKLSPLLHKPFSGRKRERKEVHIPYFLFLKEVRKEGRGRGPFRSFLC